MLTLLAGVGAGKKRKQPDPEEEALSKREFELWKATVRSGSSNGTVTSNSNTSNGSAENAPGSGSEAPRPSKQMSLASFVRPQAAAAAALEGGAPLAVAQQKEAQGSVEKV
eukprot:1741343-Rhodomonas_salina.2